MRFTPVALLFLAGFSVAAPAEVLPIDGEEEQCIKREYNPCPVTTPKCCPDNPLGLTLFGPASLKCEEPANLASKSKFKKSCENESLAPYCCTPSAPYVGAFCRKLIVEPLTPPSTGTTA